ncbi:unnamed protein product [Caenorhabditis brenneri]
MVNRIPNEIFSFETISKLIFTTKLFEVEARIMSERTVGKNEAGILDNDQYQRQLEQEFEARARIVRWEEHFARKKDEAREELMHEKQQEILRIQKDRDDAIERIRTIMRNEDQDYLEEREHALEKAKQELKKEMRKLGKIVAETTEAWKRNIDELKIAYKMTEEQIETEIQSNYINKMKGRMENEEFKARKEREKNLLKLKRDLDLQRQEHHLEHLDNIQQVHEDFKNYLQSLCQANVLLFNRNYIEGFTKKIAEIRREGHAIETAFNTCATYFKMNLNAEAKAKANRHFKDLESPVNRLKVCILDILRMIADFPDEDERDYRKKEFRGIEDELSAIKECLIPFRCAFMLPRVVFKEDDVKKLTDSVRNVLRNIESINFNSSGHKNFICQVSNHSSSLTYQ